jgi:hypothetical protein
MKALFRALAFLLLLSIAAGVRAQTVTTVTGTIVDPSGIPYANGQVTINIAPPGVTSPFITATNAPILFPIPASTNGSGFFSVPLIANGSISPGGTQYTFRICTTPVPPPLGTGNSCVTSNPITIAGASQDISAAVNPLAPAIVSAALAPPKPTVLLKKGTGAGNYTTASTTYVDVDTSNLSCGAAVTIPVGQKLTVIANGNITSVTAAVFVGVSLFDAATLVEVFVTPVVVANNSPFSISWVIVGDGAAHTVKLQYRTSNASDSAQILNATATQLPSMICTTQAAN